MKLFPAIDLRAGRVVRLSEGDYARQQVYADDPLAVAESFAEAGATCLHVVDLDGAKDGAPANLPVIKRLAGAGLFMQVGGGIRSAERVSEVLGLGAGRVILGTAALCDTDFLAEMLARHGPRIAVGVDARAGRVAVSGWQEISDTPAMDFCKTLQDIGVQTVIYTDIARDGMLAGTNLAAYRALAVACPGLDVIASGGVTTAAEITALREMGMAGAIVGKALYEGRLSLAEALRATGEEAS